MNTTQPQVHYLWVTELTNPNTGECNKSVYLVMECYGGNGSITANDRTTKVANDHPLPSTSTAIQTSTGSSHFD